jgi:hypothetical protein
MDFSRMREIDFFDARDSRVAQAPDSCGTLRAPYDPHTDGYSQVAQAFSLCELKQR